MAGHRFRTDFCVLCRVGIASGSHRIRAGVAVCTLIDSNPTRCRREYDRYIMVAHWQMVIGGQTRHPGCSCDFSEGWESEWDGVGWGGGVGWGAGGGEETKPKNA